MKRLGAQDLGDDNGHKMDIPVEHVEQMEEIMVDMREHPPNCLKDFRCYKSSLEDLCKVKGIGVFDTIQCMSGDARCCAFSFGVMEDRYCQCPLRRYIAEHFCR